MALEVVTLALLNLFIVRKLCFFGFIWSIFGSDSHDFADDSFFPLNLESLIRDSNEFGFLFFVHVHEDKFVGVHIVGPHFRNAVDYFLFKWEVFVGLAVIEIYEWRSDFEQ